MSEETDCPPLAELWWGPDNSPESSRADNEDDRTSSALSPSQDVDRVMWWYSGQ